MANDPLDNLQNPQLEPSSQPSANMDVINQFNRANPQKRAVANQFGAGQLPEYDDKINRLHGIDARFLSGETAPFDQVAPDVVNQAKLLQSQGMMQPAYDLLAEENKKYLARSQYGGAMTPEEWDSLRDYAGRKAAARAAGDDATPMLARALSDPNAKQALYQSGIEAFDRILGHHKKYLVEYPKVPMKAPVSQGGAPVHLRPHEAAILQLMKQVGTIADAQNNGAPSLSPDDFSQQIGLAPKVTP